MAASRICTGCEVRVLHCRCRCHLCRRPRSARRPFLRNADNIGSAAGMSTTFDAKSSPRAHDGVKGCEFLPPRPVGNCPSFHPSGGRVHPRARAAACEAGCVATSASLHFSHRGAFEPVRRRGSLCLRRQKTPETSDAHDSSDDRLLSAIFRPMSHLSKKSVTDLHGSSNRMLVFTLLLTRVFVPSDYENPSGFAACRHGHAGCIPSGQKPG